MISGSKQKPIQLTLGGKVSNLRDIPAIYKTIVDQSVDPIFMLTLDGTVQYGNPAFFQVILQNPVSDTQGYIWDLLPGHEKEHWQDAIQEAVSTVRAIFIETDSPSLPGRVFLTTLNPLLNGSGKTESIICVSKDITEQKHTEQQLREMNSYDLLTGVYNRNYFELEMDRLQVSRMFPISIVVADMNLLKGINDRFGHIKGDEILKLVADCIRQSFRAEDVIARIGGDEFGILLPFTDAETAHEVVERLKENLRQLENPLVSLAVGVSTSRTDEEDLVVVMKRADDQMYREKMTQRYHR